MSPWLLANSYRRPNSYHCPINGGCRPYETSIPTAMKMEIERSSETPLNIYQSTWWYIPDDLNHQHSASLLLFIRQQSESLFMRSTNNVYLVNGVKSVRVCWHALITRCPSSIISGGTFSSSSSMLNSPCSFSCVDADKTMWMQIKQCIENTVILH